MNPRFRRIAVFVGTAAIAASAGIGVASKGAATPSATPNTTQQQQGPGGAPGGGADLSSLADALGVSETRLQEAMRKAHPSDPGAAGGPDEMLQTLADELGVSVDKVRAAFESTMPQRGAPPSGGAAPTAPPSGSQTA